MSSEEKMNDTEVTQPAEEAQTTQNEVPAADEPVETVQEEEKPDKPEGDTPVEQDKPEGDAPAANEKPVPVQKQKPQKSAKPRKNGMSKLFKLIYFPAIAVVFVLFLVFSIVDGVYGYKPKAYSDGYYTAVERHIAAIASPRTQLSSSGIAGAKDYIADTLKSNGFTLSEQKTDADSDDDEETEVDDELIHVITDWAKTGVTPVPTYTIMTSKPTGALMSSMNADCLVGSELTNIIAAIPSKKTVAGEKSGAVIITVRYDSRPDTAGAADNGLFVAVALQSLADYVFNGATFENDVVVVFTEDLDASYGSYVFFDAFDGFGDVVSRAKAGINLDAFGNDGTLALTDTSGAGLDYINAYTKVSGKAFNSSIVAASVPEELAMKGGVGAFTYAGIPAVQVAVVGGLDAAQSSLDSAKAVSPAIMRQAAKFFKEYVDSFANREISFAKPADGDKTVIFSYFDWGTVSYNKVAAYVFAALTLAAIGAAIAVIAIKKTFDLKKMLIALVLELAVVASVLVSMFAAYFLVTLMLTGFGALPIHAITQLRYFNGGIFFAAMLISLAAAFGFTSLYKKLFKVTSSDTVRGTALMFALAGAITGFAAPQVSYIVSWLGMLLAATLVVTACLNTKLKKKFGFGFDRLFIFTIPVILCLPITMSSLSALTVILPLYMLPVTMMVFTGMLGVAVPYLDRTAAIFDKVAKKLPPRNMRIERTVTERVEDRAKKGKFTERTVKRVVKEKVPVNYKNYFGVSLLATLAIVIALFSGGFGVNFGKSLTDMYSYKDSIYNDSLVYEWSLDENGVETQKIIVDDLIAYKYIRYAVTDLSWDSVNEYYYKVLNRSVSEIIPEQPSIVRSSGENGYLFNVKTFDGPRTAVTLTIPSASAITRITITDGRDNKYVYDFNACKEIVLRLPYGFDNFTLTFEGGSPSSIEYNEQCSFTAFDEGNVMLNIDEWNAVRGQYSGQDVLNSLRGGIVLKRTFTFG